MDEGTETIEEDDTAPTSRFQSMYMREAKPMNLNSIKWTGSPPMNLNN